MLFLFFEGLKAITQPKTVCLKN